VESSVADILVDCQEGGVDVDPTALRDFVSDSAVSHDLELLGVVG